MKLTEFLDRSGLSMVKFAVMVGTTPATISRLSSGSTLGRRGLLERVYQATDGQVTPNDLTGLHARQQAPGSRCNCDRN